MGVLEDSFFFIFPPTASGSDALHQVQSTATGAAAANFDWTTALGTNLQGQCFLLLEASTRDVYVRFKSTGAASTTVTNGLLIKADQPGRVFHVHPTLHNIIDSIAVGGAGTLQVQVCSPITYRTRH